MASLRTPPQHPCYSEKKNFHWIHGFLGYNKEPSLEENRAKNRSEEATSSFHLGPGWKSSTKFHGERHKWLVSHLPFNKVQKMQQTVSSPGSLPIQKKNATNKSSENQSHQFFASEMNKKTRTLLGFWTPLTDRKAPNFDVQFFFKLWRDASNWQPVVEMMIHRKYCLWRGDESYIQRHALAITRHLHNILCIYIYINVLSVQTHNLIVIDSPTPIFQAKKYCTSNLGIWKKNPDMMEKNPPKQFHVQLVHYSSLFPSIPIVVRHSNTTHLSSLSSATSQVSNPWLSSHGEIERMSLECPVIRKMIGKPFGW